MTALLGALSAVLISAALHRLYSPYEGQLDIYLLVLGGIGIIVLLAYNVFKKLKGAEAEGEPETRSTIDLVMTTVAVILLLFTPMLSGPYLYVVPVICILIVVVFLIFRHREDG